MWRDRAACSPETAHLFNVDAELWQHMQAAAICRGCPVQMECDEYRAKHNLTGVFAGLLWFAERRSRPILTRCRGCGAEMPAYNARTWRLQSYCSRACYERNAKAA